MKFGISSINKENIKKGLNYLKYNGVGGVMSQVRYKMTGPGLAYNNWYREKHEADAEELVAQSETHFDYEPTISVLVSVYMTPEFFLRSMIDSVKRQSYKNWELILIDGSQANDTASEEESDEESSYKRLFSKETERIIKQYADEDKRIIYHLMEHNPGISDNINLATTLASGEYIALLDHDDILSDDALFTVVSELQNARYDLIYSDEDKMSKDGSKYSDPAFKPDFDLDLIRSYNYMSRLLVVKKHFAEAVGGFRREYDGGQTYDFILRCIENTDKIHHISRVLYHYRISDRNDKSLEKKKTYTYEMEKKALAEHLQRNGEFATLLPADTPGIFRINYETPGNPHISIIIPAGKNVFSLQRLIQPLYEKMRYSNFEILLVDCETADDEMLKYFRNLEKMRRNIKVLTNSSLETLAAIKNYGASKASGKYLLFLSPNLEIDDATSLGDMLGLCMRKDVGIVTGVLYTTSNAIFHEGYAIGVNGYFDSLYKGLRRGQLGYLMHNRMNRGYSAVSSDCMLIKRSVFDELGGFREDFSKDFADIDICLKARELGIHICSVANASWIYHPDGIYNHDLPGAVIDCEENFKEIWKDTISLGDYYYNPNFARDGELFSLI